MTTRTTAVRDAAAVATATAALLFVAAPAQIHAANADELAFPLRDAAPLFCATAAALVALACAAAACWHARRWWPRAVALFFGACAAAWLEGNVLTVAQRPLDGSDTSPAVLHLLFDTALWLGVLAAASRGALLFHRHVLAICAVFVCMQLAAAASTWRGPVVRSDEPVALDAAEELVFSPERNVIVVVLDTLRGSTLDELLAREPALATAFDGFTRHRDVTGGFPTTYPSIAYLLTGRQYDNGVPIRDFLHSALFSDSSAPARLGQLGYVVELYTGLPMVDARVASNAVYGGVGRARNAHMLLRVVAYWAAPALLKEQLAPALATIALHDAENPAFARAVTERAEVRDRPRTFKLFHLLGAHAPYAHNERLEDEEMEGQDGYRRESRGAIEATLRLFRKLEALGVYDRSMIFVVSDHGQRFGDDGVSETGTPILLAKPLGARGPLQISERPVTLGDVAATILAAHGIRVDDQAIDLFDAKAPGRRQRRYLHYEWEHEYWSKRFLPSMTEYDVVGNARDPSSWRATGRVLEAPRWAKHGLSRGSGARPDAGWCESEEYFTWSCEDRTTVRLTRLDRSSVALRAKVAPYLCPGVAEQQIDVSVGGALLTRWHVSDEAEQSAVIPAGAADSVELSIASACSPASVGASPDVRRLGVRVLDAWLEPIPPIGLR